MKLEDICDKIDKKMRKDELVFYFIKGLPSKMKKYLRKRNPSSLRKAYEFAKCYIEVENEEKDESNSIAYICNVTHDSHNFSPHIYIYCC